MGIMIMMIAEAMCNVFTLSNSNVDFASFYAICDVHPRVSRPDRWFVDASIFCLRGFILSRSKGHNYSQAFMSKIDSTFIKTYGSILKTINDYLLHIGSECKHEPLEGFILSSVMTMATTFQTSDIGFKIPCIDLIFPLA